MTNVKGKCEGHVARHNQERRTTLKLVLKATMIKCCVCIRSRTKTRSGVTVMDSVTVTSETVARQQDAELDSEQIVSAVTSLTFAVP